MVSVLSSAGWSRRSTSMMVSRSVPASYWPASTPNCWKRDERNWCPPAPRPRQTWTWPPRPASGSMNCRPWTSLHPRHGTRRLKVSTPSGLRWRGLIPPSALLMSRFVRAICTHPMTHWWPRATSMKARLSGRGSRCCACLRVPNPRRASPSPATASIACVAAPNTVCASAAGMWQPPCVRFCRSARGAHAAWMPFLPCQCPLTVFAAGTWRAWC